jgi:hypothetical protein
MDKYQGLTQFLSEIDRDRVVLTFEDVNNLIDGQLPESAFKHRPWWANRKEGKGSQNLAWQSVGWETRDVNMDLDEVTFVRVKNSVYPKSAEINAGLSIAEAKAGLAINLGVAEDQIEINIRA